MKPTTPLPLQYLIHSLLTNYRVTDTHDSLPVRIKAKSARQNQLTIERNRIDRHEFY